MILHLKIIGCCQVLLALIHVVFPKYFKWRTELSTLSLINKQMVEVHTFFIALVVGLMGLLCIFQSAALIDSPLGKTICLGMGIFWSIRLLFQFFVYSPQLWRGKTFETVVHILFSVLWLYFSCVFWYSSVVSAE